MKKFISLTVLLVVMMLLAGCGQQAQVQQAPDQQQIQEQQTQASQETPVEDSSKFTFNMLYNYGLIKEYEYKITSSADGQQSTMNLKYKISSDTADGKAAWLQQSDMDVQGNTVTTKMWLDKVSLACLKISTIMNIAGQTMQQEGQCPEQGPNSASTTADALVNYVGKESVTVPAGTFSVKKYESNGVYYWIADNVPLPLKVLYSGEGAMAMELVSYK
ncbi:MAG: hypothetical protein ABIJ08_07495 [Nanoarchaeota archaeon]